MTEERFSDLGRVEAIARLYEGTSFKPFNSGCFETSGKSFISSHARTFIEGIDFDLTYFPLKHLGYKCMTAVTGELYADFAHPRTADVRLGISAKLDFSHIKELWEGDEWDIELWDESQGKSFAVKVTNTGLNVTLTGDVSHLTSNIGIYGELTQMPEAFIGDIVAELRGRIEELEAQLNK
jgi:hypothetical protein